MLKDFQKTKNLDDGRKQTNKLEGVTLTPV